MNSSILFIQHTATYGNRKGQEMLNMILAASQFCPHVSVLFCEDGVYQLLKNQHPESQLLVPYTKAYSAFPLYDIQHCYIDQTALEARSLEPRDLVISASLCTPQQIRALLISHSIILRG